MNFWNKKLVSPNENICVRALIGSGLKSKEDYMSKALISFILSFMSESFSD